MKLNYRSQNREAKRQKAVKRLDVNTETQSSNTPSTSAVHIKNEGTEATDNTEASVEETEKDESNIWKEKPVENSEKTREEEFEEYLADLLM